MAPLLLYTRDLRFYECERQVKTHRLYVVYLIVSLLTIGAMATNFSKKEGEKAAQEV